MAVYINGVFRLWMTLVIVFLAISFAPRVCLAYESTTISGSTREYNEAEREREIVMKYPGYFRTEEEQMQFEAQYQQEVAESNVIAADKSRTPSQEYCTFTCTDKLNESYPWKRRQVTVLLPLMEYFSMYTKDRKSRNSGTLNGAMGPPIFHGCCISRHFFTSPGEAVNGLGRPVELVQFNDTRQWFPTQECKQARDCSGCGCGQETVLMSAVVYNPDFPTRSNTETVLNFIRMRGCCKCFNNLPVG